MASFKHNAFGATWRDVVARVGGNQFNVQDFAHVTATVASGSTTTAIKVDSAEGLAAGQKVNVNTGAFPEQGETRTIESVDSATQFTVGSAFSSAPVAGDVVNDGPERIEEDLAWAESEVASLLPDRYRRLLARVDGEVIVRRADGGQTSATLCGVASPFTAAPSGVRLFLNYRGDWADRSEADAMDSADYAVDGCTVTFTGGLSEGDQVVAEYAHDLSAPPRVLTDAAIDLAAGRAAQRAHLDHERGEVAWVAALAEQVRSRLAGLAGAQGTTPRGIAEFDDLALYADWQREGGRGLSSGNLHLA